MIIQLRNITKTYNSGAASTHALNDIDLEIGEGEFIALMGPSGSGKSTAMNIIGFMDKATSGEYLFKQKDVTKFSRDDLARMRGKEIGFVFQSFNLLPRTTALENTILPLHYKRMSGEEKTRRAREALAMVGLETKEKSLPSQLSGGQIQRVAIARALVSAPSIIIADEPTGNLDSKSSAEIMQIFTELNRQGKTIILVTHEDDIAAYAKRVVILKDGVIIKDETK